MQNAVRDTFTVIGGQKAYPWLKRGEQFVGDVVSYAKTTIIVRSMVVGAANIASNFLHLSLRGIDPITMATKSREKFLEITAYVKNREEIQRLQVELGGRWDEPAKAARLQTRIQALEDANRALSIHPLIEAGEFSTISEGLDEADVAIREGRWADYIEAAVDKLPSAAGTVAKNVLMTKDTALFKGLNRMVQYGDFVAKAVLYDHLQKDGMGEQEIRDTLIEEFVQYNRLPGRGRDFLESMGLLWFWNYKLRIQKVAVKMLRERPLSSLMLMGGVGPSADIDSVMSGSLAGNVADGSWKHSVGMGMGLPPFGMHPASQL